MTDIVYIELGLFVLGALLGAQPWGGYALGFSIPLISLAPNLCTGIVCGFIATRVSVSDFHVSRWYAPYLLFSFLPLIFLALYPPYIGISLHTLLPLTACCLISRIIARSENDFSKIYNGLLIGFIINGIAVACWYFGFPLTHQAHYWDQQHRFGGFFTDPNAAAIASLLLIIFSFKDSFRFQIWALVPAFILALTTGSRSFFLGIFLLSVLYWSRTRIRILLFLTMGIAASWAILNGILYIAPDIQSSSLPLGLQRTLSTLSLTTMKDFLFNRVVFIQTALAIIKTSPLSGIGVGQFKELFPFFANPSLGSWTDNANNFYLGILAEQGIIGALFFGGALYSLRIHGSASTMMRTGILSFAILLFFGPHIEFLEIAVLFGLLLGLSTEERSTTPRLFQYAAIPAAFISFLLLCSSERGVYRWERDASGLFRWISSRGVIDVECDQNQALITISTFAPSGLSLRARSESELKEGFINAQPQTFSFQCEGRERTSITLVSDSTWTPHDLMSNDDRRELSVMVRYHPHYG